MSKLLKAGIRRYLTSVIFWVAVVATLLLAKLTREEIVLWGFNEFYVSLEFGVFAIMIAWVIGREYEEGIFRNKIVAGHKKATIFISEMILAVLACMCLFLLYTVILAPGNMYVLEMFPVWANVKLYVGFILTNIAMVSILVTISALLSHRGLSSILSIVLIIGMFWCTMEIGSILSEEEYTIEYDQELVTEVNQDGEENRYFRIIEGSERKIYNINYVGGWTRKRYEFIFNTMPAGQINDYMYYLSEYWDSDMYNRYYKPAIESGQFDNTKISDEDNEMMNVNILFSLGVSLFMTGVGCLVFKKVDFK